MGKFVCCLTLALLTFYTNLPAKTNNCENLSFEKGDFTNWTGKTWIHFYTEIFDQEEGIENGRHTIMSDTTAYDVNTGGKLKIIPPGYKYCARLGDSINGGLSESLSYTMTVDSTNALFIWKFAVVLQDPLHDHTIEEEPHFKITVEDQNGNAISSCSQYDVNASENIPGFQSYCPKGFTRDTDSVALVVWRDWTTAGANLMPFYGKQITITFTAEDCTKQGHYGYAYFVAECRPMEISVNFCKDDVNAELSAPEGFSNYIWTPGNISGQTLTVNNASLGDQYVCTFQSVMGCDVQLNAIITRTVPNAAFRFVQSGNDKRTFQFQDSSTVTGGVITGYLWDFGDGSTSADANPSHTFKTDGTHTVSLTITSTPSGCTSTTSKSIFINSTPLTIEGKTTLCAGDTSVLTASGRTRYLWSTSDTTAVISVTASGIYSVIGWDEYGESDTARIQITVNPAPTVTISGNTAFCTGQSTTLAASGASTYIWNNNATTVSITVSKAGTYSITGYSDNGCASKIASVTVVQDSAWQTLILGDTLFCSNAQTTLTATGGVSYRWDTGSTEQAITVNESGTYTVVSTNASGCRSQASMNVKKVSSPQITIHVSSSSINSEVSEISGNVDTEEGIQYEWKLNDLTLSYSTSFTQRMNVSALGQNNTVTLSAIDRYGCVSFVTEALVTEPHVPNVFTPNSDGHNDVFMKDYDLQIFDRNGLILYAGNNGWDGTYHGAKMDPDTYFYLLHYADSNNKEQLKKGYVMLVR